MLREHLLHKQHEPGFRWRGGEIARIEGLSDAVFAFAVTLLVVSLEVPKTFNELAELMRGFVPFAICFMGLMQVWLEQYRYFRRYNLQDSTSTMLNFILLFVVLFYVYPLKFLFTLLVNIWTRHSLQVHLANGVTENVIEPHQMAHLMAIFSSGYLAVALIFMLLFGHALRRRHALELDDVEVFATKVSIGAASLQAFVAVVSLAIVGFGGSEMGGSSGIIYPIILGPGFSIYYSIVGRKRQRLMEARQG
ncbi:MAG: TMEM175 family protein [Candidatus Solibacter sp.]